MSGSPSHPRKAPDSETCWALLERVAASTPLRRAARLRELLLYVGRRSLKEGCDELHESEIGSAVFERPADYDTSADTIVRVNATELRKRIENYFESEGTHETLVMEIPRGSYLPVFRYQAAEGRTLAEIAVLPAAVSELPRPISGARRISDRHRWILVGLVITVLAFGWATSWIQNRAMDRKSTRLNSSHLGISYAVFCLKKKHLNRNGLDRDVWWSGTQILDTLAQTR